MFYSMYLSSKSASRAVGLGCYVHIGHHRRLLTRLVDRLTIPLLAFSGVCQRRQWPDPRYEPYRTRHGHFCKVRVNNREYCTDVPYESEALARDGAAMKAYMICRNFSVNDGMFPGQRPGQRTTSGVVQGLPVAIGTGRKSNRSSASSYDMGSTDGTSSGGNSPRNPEVGFEQQLQQVTQQMLNSRPHTRGPKMNDEYMCYCRRGVVRAYGRCGWCLRENGWA